MEYKLTCVSLYEDESYYWFSELRFNAFYRVEKATMKAEFLFHFPGEVRTQGRLFGKPAKVGDWLIFPPRAGNTIALYNLNTEEVKSISIERNKNGGKVAYRPMAHFLRTISIGNQVYFIPLTYPAIMKLNVQTLELEYLDQWLPLLEEKIKKERSPLLNFYFSDALVKGTKAYLPCSCTNCVLIFDLEREDWEIVSIPGTVEAFQTIVFDGEYHWITPRFGGTLTKWNRETGESKAVPLVKHWPEGVPLVHSPEIYQGTLYLSGGKNGTPYKVDCQSGRVQQLDFLQELQKKPKEYGHLNLPEMFCSCLEGDLWHFISGRNLNWYTYNLDTQELTCKVLLADQVGREILGKIPVKGIESQNNTLRDFCNFVKGPDSGVKDRENDGKTIGQTILDATT